MNPDSVIDRAAEIYMEEQCGYQPPPHWHQICELKFCDDSHYAELELLDWMSARAESMLGELTIEHLDLRGMIREWVSYDYVVYDHEYWYFTRKDLADVWLPKP